VVISIFGDLVQPRQQTISVQELLSLTGHAGIEENAVRTALSRLAKEGWVERRKDGRHAFYRLNDLGKTSFLAATERIYNHSFVSQSSRWNLGFFDSPVSYAKDEMPLGFTLSKHWQLINDEDAHHFSDANNMLFPTSAVDAPEWVLENLLPDNLAKHYRDFLLDIKPLTEKRDAIKLMSPLCALTTRFLLIHAWRRMVLRHPLMPQGLLPPDWPGATCHDAICSIYPQLVERSEPWWEVPTSNAGISLLKARFSVL
jgi:phenylacetic acid degradation operon negative regulatory protein